MCNIQRRSKFWSNFNFYLLIIRRFKFIIIIINSIYVVSRRNRYLGKSPSGNDGEK